MLYTYWYISQRGQFLLHFADDSSVPLLDDVDSGNSARKSYFANAKVINIL